MRLNHAFKKLCSICCLLALVGCGGSTQYNERDNFSEPGSSKYSRAYSLKERSQFYGEEVSASQEKTLRRQGTFHFEYDKYEISQEDLLAVYAHARYLILHPKARVRIDGHTDQQGSREYNIALGERRSKAVRNVLLFKGVLPSQIDIVSFGKEKLISFGEDDGSRQLNRRAEIHYVMNDAKNS